MIISNEQALQFIRIAKNNDAKSIEERCPMDDNRIQATNMMCANDFHDEHLCYIVAQRFDIENPIAYKALIVDPHYRCDHCGRHADRQKSLCKPQPL